MFTNSPVGNGYESCGGFPGHEARLREEETEKQMKPQKLQNGREKAKRMFASDLWTLGKHLINVCCNISKTEICRRLERSEYLAMDRNTED